MYKVNKMDRLTINLSQEHNDNATGVQFDYSEWIEKYGEGSIILTHKRRGDAQPYLVSLDTEDGVATWHVSDIDTAVRGGGTCQLMYQTYDGKVLEHSALARTVVLESNYGLVSTPDGYDNWLAELAGLAGTTTHNVDLAENAAIRSEASANRSETVKNEVELLKAGMKIEIDDAKAYVDDKKNVIDKAVADASGFVNAAEASARSAEGSASDARTSAQASITAKNEAEAMKNTTATLKADTEAIKQQTAQLKSDTNAIKTETAQLKADTQSIKNNTQALVNGFDSRVAAAKTEIDTKKAEGVKAVEDTIATIPEDYTELVGEVGNVKGELITKADAEDLATANRKIKALTDVLNGKELAFETTDYNSAKVDVPSGAVADSVLKIGGKSIVLNQMLNVMDGSGTSNGITYRIENGVITCNGTASANFISNAQVNFIKGHKYLLLGAPKGGSWETYFIQENQNWHTDTGDGIIFTATENATHVITSAILKGVTANNLVFKPQLFDLTQMGMESATAEDIRALIPNMPIPFTAPTIISSQTDALEMRGKNLLKELTHGNIPYTTAGITFTPVFKDGLIQKINARGTATASAYYSYNEIELKGGTYFISGITATQSNVLIQLYQKNSSGQFDVITNLQAKEGLQVTVPKGVYKLFITIREGITIDRDFYPQIEERFVATSYVPPNFKTIMLNLPSLNNGDAIDLDNCQIVRKMKEYTFTGSERYEAQTRTDNYQWYSIILPNMSQGGSYPLGVNDVITLDFGDYGEVATDRLGHTHRYDAIYFSVPRDVAFSEGVQNYIKGKKLIYTLAEPIITDIDPLPQLEAINVESGGQLTFVDHSELAMPIPTTHEWVVRNEEV